MASSYQKLTAEQVRARYHQRFLADDLQPPRIVDALDADGLIHSSKRDAPLKVHIPLWDGRPPFPGADPNVLRMEWRPSSSEQWLPVGNPEEVPGPDGLPDDRFPLEREIPLLIFRDYEGVFEFRYRVKNWNDGSERESPEVPVTIDRTGPVWVDPLKAMIDIVEKPVITDAVLARDNGVFCIIPDFIEANRPEVSVSVVWMTRPPLPTEDITDFIVYTGLLPADREVLVPADVVRGYGSTTQYAVAILFDKAGNRGERSLPATVPVALGSLPTGLHPCTVPLAEDAERLIDRADAAFPTRVHIEEYTGWLHNHGVQIRWGGQILARTSVGSHGGFPLKIAVPWPRMSQEYDFDSATHVQPVAVDYKILVGDYPFDSPGAININTDFAVPKPGKPDPELIDPSLNLVEFESFSGSHTELTMADINQPATASIELFDDPNHLNPALPDDPLYPARIDFCYDADGNLLRDEVGRKLEYDSLGRLIRVCAPSGESGTDYQYDSLDELGGLETSSGSEQRYYNQGKLTNQIKSKSGDSSTFFHAEGIALAELKEGAGPKS